SSLRGTVKADAPRIAMAGYAAERVQATVHVDGRRVGIDGHASAYGASATANGRVTLPEGKEPLAFDVHGAVRRLDLRRLPASLKAPSASTDVNADYHVAGTPEALDGDLRFAQSTVPGARIAQGSTIGFSMKGKEIGYSADATVADVDLQRIGQAF